jgi:hypothetical protein
MDVRTRPHTTRFAFFAEKQSAKAGLQSANPLPTAIHVVGGKGQVAKIQAAKTTFATCHG